MSYAYFQGQEAQALDYYKKLLTVETDANSRKELEVIIERLEKALSQARELHPIPQTLQNAAVA